MKKLSPFLPRILLFVLPCLGFFIGRIIFSSIIERESFISWNQLDSSLNFEKIEDVNTNTIWARAANNKLYFREIYCYEAKCDQWIETENVPDNAHDHQVPINKGATCPIYLEYQPKKSPPKKVVECTLGVRYGQASGNYYALLDDGTIWYQAYPVGSDVPDVRILIYPCSGGMLGILAAGIMYYVITKKVQ
jgi:hypothetical protein